MKTQRSAPPAASFSIDPFVNFGKGELDQPIYRFLSFQRLIELFRTGTLTLVRTDLWDDPWENYITHVKFKIGRATTQFEFRRTVYGSCWTRKSVSDALWRIYSPDKMSVRIASTPRFLGNALATSLAKRPKSSWFIGRVLYLAQSDIVKRAKNIAHEIAIDRSGVGAAKSVLFKRRSFAHEDEVRVLVIDRHAMARKGMLRIRVDPHVLLTSVMIDSRAPKEVAEMYRAFLKKELAFRGRIVRSTLYDLPEAFEVDLADSRTNRPIT